MIIHRILTMGVVTIIIFMCVIAAYANCMELLPANKREQIYIKLDKLVDKLNNFFTNFWK